MSRHNSEHSQEICSYGVSANLRTIYNELIVPPSVASAKWSLGTTDMFKLLIPVATMPTEASWETGLSRSHKHGVLNFYPLDLRLRLMLAFSLMKGKGNIS